MFICVGKLEYNWDKKVKALDHQDYQRLRDGVRCAEMKKILPQIQSDFNVGSSYLHFDYLMDADEAKLWMDVGVEVTMSRLSGVASNARELHRTVYQISVANVGLMEIRRVEVLEDCCTDDLQRQLDRGWRLLAVCPPNDARRPSYVVGHMKEEA